jgi:hypothetical protein
MRSEQELDFLEKHIPKLAEGATQKAYYDALSKGNAVLESIDGKIYRVLSDGTKTFIKNVEVDVPISRG